MISYVIVCMEKRFITMQDSKEISKKLSQNRNRKEKEALTNDELLEQLYRIRDGASEWLEQCVIYGKRDGIKEAQQLMDHSMKKIASLLRIKKAKDENMRREI